MKKLKMATLVGVILALLLAVSPLTAAAGVDAASATPAVNNAFDPSVFGRVLSDQELDEVDGEVWTLVGMAVSATLYMYNNGIDYENVDWWIGLGVSTAMGALPLVGGSIAGSAGGIGMQVYGAAGSTLVGELLGSAVKSALDSFD